MTSFSQEMLKYLQPELLQRDEILNILMKKGVPSQNLKLMDSTALLEIFKNVAVPKSQRRNIDLSKISPSPRKNKSRIVFGASDERHIFSSNSHEKESSVERGTKNTPKMDPFKTQSEVSKPSEVRNVSMSTVSIGQSISNRLKPPPDLSQRGNTKIKLNRSSSENLDNGIIHNQSKFHHSSSGLESKVASSLSNSSLEKLSNNTSQNSNLPSKKITLKRAFDSSQISSVVTNGDSDSKKKKLITWP